MIPSMSPRPTSTEKNKQKRGRLMKSMFWSSINILNGGACLALVTGNASAVTKLIEVKSERSGFLMSNLQTPVDSVCRRSKSEEKSGAMMSDPEWRDQSRSQKPKEAEEQPSALWEVVSSHNKSMLVISNDRL